MCLTHGMQLSLVRSAGLAAAMAGTLAVSACTTSVTAPLASAPAPVRACLVSGAGGVHDAGFNANAWAGFERARTELDVDTTLFEPATDADFVTELDAAVAADCTLIVTMGFPLGQVAAEYARDHLDRQFVTVDVEPATAAANVRGVVFEVQQASFLAGYVAAAVSETGVVGTWGGQDIPPVRAFLDGYLAGVRRYNTEHDTAVQVAGWNGTTGVFAESFTDRASGRRVTQELLHAGADVVLPASGASALGAADVVAGSGHGALIWVDSDGFTATRHGSLMLTSVLKRSDVVVFEQIEAALAGDFSAATYVGTLANDGVGLAPFHDFQDDVPDAVQRRLPELSDAIAAGRISVQP